MLRKSRSALTLATALLCAAPITGAQQASAPAADTATRVTVFSRGDVITAGAFALATVALIPFDQHIAVDAQRPSLQNNGVLSHGATAFRFIGGPGSIAISAATYLAGRAGNSPRSAELGLRAFESIGVASVTTYLIKGVVGRARPFVVADTNPRDFNFGRGFRDDKYTSFPSGHATAAFAAASAASQEISYLWPRASHLWTPALYTGASLVALSRVYNDKHWASDVVAGAAVGTLAARAVVRFQRAHPRNSVDRWLLPSSVSRSVSSSVRLDSSGRRVRSAPGVSFAWNYQW